MTATAVRARRRRKTTPAITLARRIATRSGSARWSLVIPSCPFCAGPHYHGGGTGDEPLLGERAAHCPGGGVYELVPAPEGSPTVEARAA